jgi:hypothetical protein
MAACIMARCTRATGTAMNGLIEGDVTRRTHEKRDVLDLRLTADLGIV